MAPNEHGSRPGTGTVSSANEQSLVRSAPGARAGTVKAARELLRSPVGWGAPGEGVKRLASCLWLKHARDDRSQRSQVDTRVSVTCAMGEKPESVARARPRPRRSLGCSSGPHPLLKAPDSFLKQASASSSGDRWSDLSDKQGVLQGSSVGRAASWPTPGRPRVAFPGTSALRTRGLEVSK